MKPELRNNRQAAAGIILIALSTLLGSVISLSPYPIHTFDLAVYGKLFLTTPAPHCFWITLSTLGGLEGIAILILGALIIFSLRRHAREGLICALATGTAALLAETLKPLFEAHRPIVAHIITSGSSYPSSHATVAFALGISLLLVLLPRLKSSIAKTTLLLACFALPLLVAASRLALGAHWFSDIIGGILLGTGVALLFFGIPPALRKRT